MSLRGLEPTEIDPLFQNSVNNESNDINKEKDYISELVGLGPYPLQLACYYLEKFKNEHRSFNLELKQKFESIVAENLNDYHQRLWEQMDEPYHSILSQLASGRKIPSAQQYLVRDLSKRCYIMNNNGNSQISSALLKKFILQISGIQTHSSISTNKFYGFISRIKQFILNIKN
jgi:hypothetical protein